MKRQPVTIIRAAALRDARRCDARPGAVAVRAGRVIAAGAPNRLPRRLWHGAAVVDRPEHLLLPATVNAHAHLDLTTAGPVPYEGDFAAWLRGVIAARPSEPAQILAAVHRGLELSRRAGVGCVGDIAGSVTALTARRDADAAIALAGVSYLECFGLAEPAAREAAQAVTHTLDALAFETPIAGQLRGVVLGIAPHAPYSAGLALYEAVTRLSQRHIYRLTTHLAESQAELELLRDGTGPLAEMLREMGKFDADAVGAGQHPVDALAWSLKHGRWLAAHCNYLDDAHIELLKRTGTSVVYCPMASDYFGHEGHRYRDLLGAGVNVALGTDALLCQGWGASAQQPLGIVPQMRHLYRRDGTDPAALLAMATVNGRRALDFNAADATIHRGAPASFTAVPIDARGRTDPLLQALESDEPASLLRVDTSGAVEG